jgi:hypothetical protein
LQQAEDWLNQIVKLIPQEYWLVKGRGFLEVAEPDEGYWLALGKLHLQRGIWAFRNFPDAAGSIKPNVLTEAITNYALAIAYFVHYWPRSYNWGLAIRSFARHLEKLEHKWVEEVRRSIHQVSDDYKVDLDPMQETVADTLGI